MIHVEILIESFIRNMILTMTFHDSGGCWVDYWYVVIHLQMQHMHLPYYHICKFLLTDEIKL